MDYKEKYEAALAKARKLKEAVVNNDIIGFPGQFDEIFPELRESEDERIRTRLSEYFRGFLEGNEHCYEDGGYVKWEGLDVKSILNWLEKQRESNIDKLHKISTPAKENWFEIQEQWEQEDNKEQKPEWSEEDVRMLESIINLVGGTGSQPNGLRGKQIPWLKDLPNRFNLQPKQEWSEDTMDEFTRNIRNLITDKLTVHTKGLDGSEVSSTVFIDDKTAKDIASGILFYVGKEAVKNPNREIPEWSEEDESSIELIRMLILSARNVQSNSSLWKQYDDALAWLDEQKDKNCKMRLTKSESYDHSR